MISATILTKNSEKYLDEVLGCLRHFDEVLVLDSGSTDQTQEIAEGYPNVTWYQEPFRGFGPMHNRAAELAKHDWILSIDSDEVASVDLIEELKGLQLDDRRVYSFPRCNYFNGKWIKRCGWFPDRVLRLYHRQSTRWSDDQVHERVLTEGLTEHPLSGAIKHYSYEKVADFLQKMQLYSDLFAQQNAGKKGASICKAVLHGGYAFTKSYVLQLGFLEGREGFIISAYNGMTCYYKYLKLWEANQ